MTRPRILIVHETMETGGAERVLADILGAFDYERYDVTLLLYGAHGPFLRHLPDRLKVVGLHPGPVPGRAERLHSRMRYRLPFLYRRWLRKAMRRTVKSLGTPFDTIVSFMEGPAAMMHDCITDFGRRNISWVHCDLSSFDWAATTFPHSRSIPFYRRMDAVAVISRRALLGFEGTYGVTGRNYVMYNPIDLGKVQAMAYIEKSDHGDEVLDTSDRALGAGNGEKPLRLAICGRLLAVKRQHLAILALADLLRRGVDARLTIIGDGPERDALKRCAAENGVTDRVTFTGLTDNPYRFMGAADICLMTSQTEGLGMVILEAMALGRPVVAVRIPATEELVTDGSGILCGDSPSEIADAVLSLRDDGRLRERCIASGRDRVAGFAVESFMQRFYNLLTPNEETVHD